MKSCTPLVHSFLFGKMSDEVRATFNSSGLIFQPQNDKWCVAGIALPD